MLDHFFYYGDFFDHLYGDFLDHLFDYGDLLDYFPDYLFPTMTGSAALPPQATAMNRSNVKDVRTNAFGVRNQWFVMSLPLESKGKILPQLPYYGDSLWWGAFEAAPTRFAAPIF